MRFDLARLFKPKSIAVVGGGVWCRSVLEQCKKMNYQGALYAVHPKADNVAGIKAVASVLDLPQPPDACFVGVNRHATVDVVADLSAMGAGGAVCFASGFLEAHAEADDGASLQNALLEAAGPMPIVGPNCYGFVNYLDGAPLWPDQHGGQVVESGVAIITQSSNMAINISMQQRGLPIAFMVTAGNQAQIGLAEIGAALLRDPRITALGLHIEGIGDIAAFEALAAEAKAQGKGIAAIKVGRSTQAQTATLSHTASLAGSDAGAEAVLRRLGIARLESLTELLETLKLLHFTGPLSSNKVASMSCSGGEASLMADTGLTRDIVFPELNRKQKAGLRAALGPMVALANPLDYHTYIWGDGPGMGAAFSAMMQGDIAIGCIIVDFPRADRCSQAAWDCVFEAAIIATRSSGKPLALVASVPENIPEDIAHRMLEYGILPLCGLPEALGAIEAAAFIGSKISAQSPPILQGQQPITSALLSEYQAKSDLSAFGLKAPRGQQVSSLDNIRIAADKIGYPVVLKAMGFAHKSEAGAVKVGIEDAASLAAAVQDMQAQQWLIEEMVTGAIAELLVGVVLDPAHGFVLTLAAGGVLTEVLQDRVSLILPVEKSALHSALDQLKIARVLAGYRGKSAANRDAIVDAILAVQDYVIAHCDQVEEVEINPLIVTEKGAVAADALIKKGERDDR